MSEAKEPTMAELYSNPELNIKRKRRWGWIFISFFFFSLANSTGKNNINGAQSITLILYLISAIVAPILYYRMKLKVKVFKNNFLKSFILGVVAIIGFSLMSAILGAVIYALI